jgi:hypothetical protein
MPYEMVSSVRLSFSINRFISDIGIEDPAAVPVLHTWLLTSGSCHENNQYAPKSTEIQRFASGVALFDLGEDTKEVGRYSVQGCAFFANDRINYLGRIEYI